MFEKIHSKLTLKIDSSGIHWKVYSAPYFLSTFLTPDSTTKKSYYNQLLVYISRK